LVAEAKRNGLIGAEDAASLAEVPNIPQKGTRLGNWLTREKVKELLTVPDRSTLKRVAFQIPCRCSTSVVELACALDGEEYPILARFRPVIRLS
jgi:hypothetical protein